jgi:hypothetical protein
MPAARIAVPLSNAVRLGPPTVRAGRRQSRGARSRGRATTYCRSWGSSAGTDTWRRSPFRRSGAGRWSRRRRCPYRRSRSSCTVVHDLIVRTNACHTSSRSRATMIRARTVCDVAWTGSELRRVAIPIPISRARWRRWCCHGNVWTGGNGRGVEGRQHHFFLATAEAQGCRRCFRHATPWRGPRRLPRVALPPGLRIIT